MHITLAGSRLCERDQDIFAFTRVKRSLDDVVGTLLPTIIIPVVFLSVFVALFFPIHRAWKLERAEKLKNQEAEAKEEGDQAFGKAELSSGSSVIINEIDTPPKLQELPESKEGLSHELPGSIILPQELPAAVHEMSAEDYDSKNQPEKPSTRVALKG
ncbi:hypothetical protein ANO14919_011360 [Xylariales sp. No.14919]|nr:hypothetical protein ANO14919_011360 [Xylariales sp. No.14919]